MKPDMHGLNFKLWKYFAAFTAAILVALWLFQIVFLQSFYESMKTAQLVRLADEIASEYGKADFQDTIDKLSFDNTLRVIVVGNDRVVLYSGDEYGIRRAIDPSPGFQIMVSQEYDTLRQKLEESGKSKVTYTATNPRIEGKTIIYGAKLSDTVTLYVSSPLQPINSTTEVLKTQLIYVTILALLLGLLISFFISRHLSKPIAKITRAASVLARGDYDVVFERGGYSEIDELATTLNYTTRELSKVEGLRRDLIANISHDLRTPLTMVKSYAEMIRDISGDNAVKRNTHVGVIIDEADRLTALVNDILDLSKLQSGNVEPKPLRFDLSDLVKNILSRFDVLRERDGYIFDVDMDEGTMVFADRMQIEQVVYNLIGNAVNYTGGDKKITVKLKYIDGTVRFEVSDTGDGIPKQELEAIWERYYKAEGTHKREVVGTGLGLSIVRGILEAHGARFGVGSEVGEGSTFWFELIS